jgi:hypothetical protein
MQQDCELNKDWAVMDGMMKGQGPVEAGTPRKPWSGRPWLAVESHHGFVQEPPGM